MKMWSDPDTGRRKSGHGGIGTKTRTVTVTMTETVKEGTDHEAGRAIENGVTDIVTDPGRATDGDTVRERSGVSTDRAAEIISEETIALSDKGNTTAGKDDPGHAHEIDDIEETLEAGHRACTLTGEGTEKPRQVHLLPECITPTTANYS